MHVTQGPVRPFRGVAAASCPDCDPRQTDHGAYRDERVVGRMERAVKPGNHRRLADGGAHHRERRRQASTDSARDPTVRGSDRGA